MGCCGGIDTKKQKRDNERASGVAVSAQQPPSQYNIDPAATDNVNMQRAVEVQRAKYHKRHFNG